MAFRVKSRRHAWENLKCQTGQKSIIRTASCNAKVTAGQSFGSPGGHRCKRSISSETVYNPRHKKAKTPSLTFSTNKNKKKLSTGIRNFTPLANNLTTGIEATQGRKSTSLKGRTLINRKNQDETINTKIWKSLLNKDNENNAYV